MDNEMLFNSEIYTTECIEYSAEQYKELAEISVSYDGKMMKCRFDNCRYGLSETMNEFGNFVIEALFSRV